MGDSVHLVYDSGYNDVDSNSLLWDTGWQLSLGTAASGGQVIAIEKDTNTTQQCWYAYYKFSYVDSTGFTHPFLGQTRLSRSVTVSSIPPCLTHNNVLYHSLNGMANATGRMVVFYFAPVHKSHNDHHTAERRRTERTSAAAALLLEGSTSLRSG